ncbi:uncharacterized protein LOC117335525 isoform X2 [Pecten maximus]|uniref:uncharacterized protein LOC117335525 isoform X2 n=1 Tax=Pecten maximus TaxID=6579 RepID=UPI001458FFA2|nr:uncharacterized protein LOC117335525 isoform X2 [Pecten maximus]
MNFCTLLLGFLMTLLIYEDLCGVNANHLSGNSNRTLARNGGRLGTARRADRLATSRRTVGTETLRRTASGRVITSRRNVGTTNTRVGAANSRVGPANTRFGIGDTRGSANARGGANARVRPTNTRLGTANTRVGIANTRIGTENTRLGSGNTRVGIANTRVGTENTRLGSGNTRVGVANTRVGTENTRVGIANSRGRGVPGTSPSALDNARVILTPVQQGAVRSMRNLLQNGRSATGRGSNPRLIGFLIPRSDGRTQLQLMPDARRFLGGDIRRFNGGVRPQVQRNSTLPLNLRTIINAARRANLLPRQSAGGSRNPAAGREQSIVVLRPRDGETGGLLQAPGNLRSGSVRNQILEERNNAFRIDRNRMDRLDRFTTTRPLDRGSRTRSRPSVAIQEANRIDQSNRRNAVDQSRSGRRTIAVARDRNPLPSGVDQFTNPGPDPNQFVSNNTPNPRTNDAFVDTATPPLQDRTLFRPSSVTNINDLPVTPSPQTINTDPLEVFPAPINTQATATQTPMPNNEGFANTVFQAASDTQSVPHTSDRNANIQTVDAIAIGSQRDNMRFEQSPVIGTSTDMQANFQTNTQTNAQTNIQTDMPPIQPQSSTSIQTGIESQGNRQTVIQPAFTPQPVFNTLDSLQPDTTQTLAQTISDQQTVFDPSINIQNNNIMLSESTSSSVLDAPISMQTATTLQQTPSSQQTIVDTSMTSQTNDMNNIMQTDFLSRPIVGTSTSTQTGVSQNIFDTPQTGQVNVETTVGTGISPNQAPDTTIITRTQAVQPQNNMNFIHDAGNVVDSTMLLPPPILPASSGPANVNTPLDQNIAGQIDQSMFNPVQTGSVTSTTNDILANIQALDQQASSMINSQFDQSQFANAATANIANNQIAVNSQPGIQSQSFNLDAIPPTQTDTLPPIQNNANLGQFTSNVINNAIDGVQTQQEGQLVNANSPSVDPIVGQIENIGLVNMQNQILDQNLIQSQNIPSTNILQNEITNRNAIGSTNTISMNTQDAFGISQGSGQMDVLNTIQGQSNMRNPNFVTIEITGQTKQQGDVTGQTGIHNSNIVNTLNTIQNNNLNNNLPTDPFLTQTFVSNPGTAIEMNNNINNNLPTDPFLTQTFVSNPGTAIEMNSNSVINQFPAQPDIPSNSIGVKSNVNQSMSAGVISGDRTMIMNSNSLASDLMTANPVQVSIPDTTLNTTSKQSSTATNIQTAIGDLTVTLNRALLTNSTGGQNSFQTANLLTNTTSSQTFTENLQNPTAGTNTIASSINPSYTISAATDTNLNVNPELVANVVASAILDTTNPVQPAQSGPGPVLTRVEITNQSANNPPPPILPPNIESGSKTVINTSIGTGEINSAANKLSFPPQEQIIKLAPVELPASSIVLPNNTATIQNNAPFTPQAPNVPMDLPTLKTTSQVLNMDTVSITNSASFGKGTLLTNETNVVPSTVPSQPLPNGASVPEQVTGLPVTSSLPDILVAADGNTANTQVRQQRNMTETASQLIEHGATAFKTASGITDVAMPTAVKALIQTSLNTSGLVGNLNKISNTSTKSEMLAAAGGIVESALASSKETLGKALTNAAPNRPQNVVMDISTLKTLISEVLSEFFSHQFNPAKTALTPTAVINTVAQAVVDARKYASPSASNSASGAVPGQEPVQAIFTTSPQAPTYPKDPKLDFPPPPPFAGMTESINIPRTEIVDIRPSNAVENVFLSRSANTDPINPVLIGEPNLKNTNSPGGSTIGNNKITNHQSRNIASPIIAVNTATMDIKKDNRGSGTKQVKAIGIADDQNIFSSTIVKTPNIDSLRVIAETNVVFNQNLNQGFRESGIRQPLVGGNGAVTAGTVSEISTRRSVVSRNSARPIPSLSNINRQTPLVNNNMLTVLDGQMNQVNSQTGSSGRALTADFNTGNRQITLDRTQIAPSLRKAEFDAIRGQMVRRRTDGVTKVTADDPNFLANIPDSLLSSFNNDFTSLSPLLRVTKSTPLASNDVPVSGINTHSTMSKIISTQSNFQGTTNQFTRSKMTTPFGRLSTRRPLRTTSNSLSAEKSTGFGGQRTSTSPFVDAGGVSVAPSTSNMPLFRSTFSGTSVTRKPLFSTTRTRPPVASSVTNPRMINTGVTRSVRTSGSSSQPLLSSTVTQSSQSTQGAPSFGFDPSKSFGLLGLPPPPPSDLMEMNATASIADTAISSSQLSLMNIGSSPTSVRTNRLSLSTLQPSVTVDPFLRSSTIRRSSPAVTSAMNFNTPLV